MSIHAQTPLLEPSRRRFLLEAGGGFGALALAAMMADERRVIAAPNTASPMVPRPSHVVPRATRVIYQPVEKLGDVPFRFEAIALAAC